MQNKLTEINRQPYVQWGTEVSCTFVFPGLLIFQGHLLVFDNGANQREGRGRIIAPPSIKLLQKRNGNHVHEFG